ncbi:MAG: hypothetical protein WBQ34_03610 [Candidatus Acidiferrales bacterium]
MKIAISAAALLLLLGTTASVNARQDNHQQGDHPETNHQESKPEHKAAKPAQEHGKTAPSHTQHAAHPQQNTSNHARQAARPQQRTTNRTERAARPQQRPMSHPQHANARPTPRAHGRISDAHYRSSFGSQHRFHVSRNDYQHHMFRYGGYSFRFVDPWPPAWAYSDPVYVVYVDGGYYMYDPVHPGLRITLTIF